MGENQDLPSAYAVLGTALVRSSGSRVVDFNAAACNHLVEQDRADVSSKSASWAILIALVCVWRKRHAAAGRLPLWLMRAWYSSNNVEMVKVHSSALHPSVRRKQSR